MGNQAIYSSSSSPSQIGTAAIHLLLERILRCISIALSNVQPGNETPNSRSSSSRICRGCQGDTHRALQYLVSSSAFSHKTRSFRCGPIWAKSKLFIMLVWDMKLFQFHNWVTDRQRSFDVAGICLLAVSVLAGIWHWKKGWQINDWQVRKLASWLIYTSTQHSL